MKVYQLIESAEDSTTTIGVFSSLDKAKEAADAHHPWSYQESYLDKNPYWFSTVSQFVDLIIEEFELDGIK